MSRLAILACENERINKLPIYIPRKKHKTESFVLGEKLFDVTVIFSKNNFSHTGNIIENEQFPYIAMTEKFKNKFGNAFVAPEGTTLLTGKHLLLELIPEIIRKLIKISPKIKTLAIDTTDTEIAKKAFDYLNPYFRDMVFISDNQDCPLFKESEKEYGIPSSLIGKQKMFSADVIIKTGADKIITERGSCLFDLSDRENSNSSITNAEILLDVFFPYQVRHDILAEFLILNGIKPKYKLVTLRSKKDNVTLSQLIKKD